jgi:phage gp29-like protein
VKDSGSRALGQVHEGVKQGMVEAVADSVAETLKGQLIAPLIELNYGHTTELPDLIPDVEAPKDELALAQRDLILFNQMKVPISLNFIYARHNLPQPDPDEALYKPPGGDCGVREFDAPTRFERRQFCQWRRASDCTHATDRCRRLIPR